jgi:hypothetical protein
MPGFPGASCDMCSLHRPKILPPRRIARNELVALRLSGDFCGLGVWFFRAESASIMKAYDGAGEVIAVGTGVDRFKVGIRSPAAFFKDG